MEIEKIAESIAEMKVGAIGNKDLEKLTQVLGDMVILGVIAKGKGEELLYRAIKDKLMSIIKDLNYSIKMAKVEKSYTKLERELEKLKSVEEKIKRDTLLSKKDISYMLDTSLPQIDIWLRDYNPIPGIQLKAGGAVKFRWCDVVAWVDANNIRWYN